MALPRLNLPGWYAAWVPQPGRRSDPRVVFGFRDQERRFVVEMGHRYVAIDDPVLAGTRYVGPFHTPEAAQAALCVAQDFGRQAARVAGPTVSP